MANVTEIKAKIEKLEKGLKLKAISALQKVKMRKQIKELKSELADAQKSAKKPTKKATTKRKAKFNEQDAQRPAKPIGRRTSADGNVYYEYRDNRTDRKQPPKRYPRLEDGGVMAKGGGVGTLAKEVEIVALSQSGARGYSVYDTMTNRRAINIDGTYEFDDSQIQEIIGEKNMDDFYDGKYKFKPIKKLNFDFFADGGVMAKGGIFGSDRNLSRDRMFKSQQEWEQDYQRKTKPKNPHYKEDGGLTNVGGTMFNDTDLSGLTNNDVSAGYFAKGGNLSSKYKYVPNRMIQAVEIEKNGREVEIDGADIIDGLYVKKSVKLANGGELHKTEMYAKGGMTEHGLKRGDEIIDDQFWDNSIVVRNLKDGTRAVVKLSTGERKESKL
jgi:hypothetical protein